MDRIEWAVGRLESN